MTKAGFQVDGADTLARTTAAAAKSLRDLTATNRAVAEGVAASASPPRRTGALAGSLSCSSSATESEVSSSLVYAGVIEYGWARHGIEATSFLTSAATGRDPASIDLYERAVNDALAKVRGT